MTLSMPNGQNPMHSLVVLMIEHEQPEGLSSRKLVVETAKHNVLTAYTPEDGLELLRRFPAVDLILVHAAVLDNEPLITQFRAIAPAAPVVVATPNSAQTFPGADFVISSHDPQALIDLLAQEFQVPKAPDEPEDR